jgi:hypothetical protein
LLKARKELNAQGRSKQIKRCCTKAGAIAQGECRLFSRETSEI